MPFLLRRAVVFRASRNPVSDLNSIHVIFFFFPPREHLENLMTKSQAYSRKLFEYILKQDTWINQGRRKHLMNYFTCLIYGWNTFIH